jgi:hypothetical protein
VGREIGKEGERKERKENPPPFAGEEGEVTHARQSPGWKDSNGKSQNAT